MVFRWWVACMENVNTKQENIKSIELMAEMEILLNKSFSPAPESDNIDLGLDTLNSTSDPFVECNTYDIGQSETDIELRNYIPCLNSYKNQENADSPADNQLPDMDNWLHNNPKLYSMLEEIFRYLLKAYHPALSHIDTPEIGDFMQESKKISSEL